MHVQCHLLFLLFWFLLSFVLSTKTRVFHGLKFQCKLQHTSTYLLHFVIIYINTSNRWKCFDRFVIGKLGSGIQPKLLWKCQEKHLEIPELRNVLSRKLPQWIVYHLIQIYKQMLWQPIPSSPPIPVMSLTSQLLREVRSKFIQ